jgi:hypothetical protein
MWHCHKCNSDNPASASFCQTCGEKKAVPGSEKAAAATLKVVSASNGGTKPVRRIENYLRVNAMAGFTNALGTILIVLGVIATIVIFFVSFRDGGLSSFFLRLLVTIVSFPINMIPGLILKALGHTWQNSEDTMNLLRYQIDVQSDHER